MNNTQNDFREGSSLGSIDNNFNPNIKINNNLPIDNSIITKGKEINLNNDIPNTNKNALNSNSSTWDLKSSKSSKLNNLNKTLSTAGKVAETISPFVDNAVNAYITSQTPEIAKPVLNIHKSLNTDVNINNQLNRINKAIAGRSREIENTSMPEITKQALKQSTINSALENKGELQMQADEIKRDIINRDRQMSDMTSSANVALINKYNQDVQARKAGMLQDYSENVANATDDIERAIERRDMKKYQDMQLEIQRKIYEDTGTFEANFNPMLAGVTDKDTDEEVRDKLKAYGSSDRAIEVYLKLRKK
jgi:hypothetical protein